MTRELELLKSSAVTRSEWEKGVDEWRGRTSEDMADIKSKLDLLLNIQLGSRNRQSDGIQDVGDTGMVDPLPTTVTPRPANRRNIEEVDYVLGPAKTGSASGVSHEMWLGDHGAVPTGESQVIPSLLEL